MLHIFRVAALIRRFLSNGEKGENGRARSDFDKNWWGRVYRYVKKHVLEVRAVADF